MKQKIRNCTIAAMLRIIYASIAYAPHHSFKKKLIRQLYDLEIFKKITKFWYETGWIKGNIQLKFLKIVRNILEWDEDFDKEIIKGGAKTTDDEKGNKSRSKSVAKDLIEKRLSFYEIVSRAIAQILINVNTAFATKTSNSLNEYTVEIKILVEISTCLRLIIERWSQFKFVDDSTEDIQEMTSKDYHKEYKSRSHDKNLVDKESIYIEGYGAADFRQPQIRLLDWITSTLISKEWIVQLITLSLHFKEDGMEQKKVNYKKEFVYDFISKQISPFEVHEKVVIESDDEEEKIETGGATTKTKDAHITDTKKSTK